MGAVAASLAGRFLAFLDIRDRVRDEGNEEGLLGLAFHPDFETNGYFFVDYTAGKATNDTARVAVTTCTSSPARATSL